ncbi:hypothetical protein H2200_009752 [Cladophialophora chaetospira]|uniref:Uncharacterized protein n=1 Tax=Cladophialophora chaetospira TaxID=386627 RepID=A0AA39CF09_9EURO|nr:hypothetical protein H2200_009752 [Cladophialophora chaetospira]
MTTHIDDFGTVSSGLDRAQLDVSPHANEATNTRPSREAVGYRKPSIRRAFKDHLLSAIINPHSGASKIKAAFVEKHESSKAESDDHKQLPTLAPTPPVGPLNKDRLTDDFVEKPRFPPAKEFLHNPVVAITTTVQDQHGQDTAENLIKAEICHGADVQLLNQAEKVENLPDGAEKDEEYETFVQMKHLRQDAFVRWTLDRHVRIVVRRIEVSDSLPKRPPFVSNVGEESNMLAWTDYGTKILKHELEKHGEYYIDPEFETIMPDRQLLGSVAERLIVASTPLQTLFMRLRSISRWDNPTESAYYMALYFFLLFFSYLTRSLILFVLLKTLYRGWHPLTLEALRDTVLKSEDKDTTAQNLGELVIQHGQRAWTEHILEQAGPELFDWGERITDIMEMTQNFLEWRNPRYTGWTLTFLFASFIVITVTPTWLLVQSSFCSVGVVFFILTPLAVKYPRYRVLLSPPIWLLWRSPSHAEWALARLQAEASQCLASEHGQASNKDRDALLIGSYACHTSNDNNDNQIAGNLFVLATSVSFSPKRTTRARLTPGSKSKEKEEAKGWSVLFEDIREIHKITHQNKWGSEEDGLEFRTFDGEKRSVLKLAKRNEVFSQIVGFSGIHWKRCG